MTKRKAKRPPTLSEISFPVLNKNRMVKGHKMKGRILAKTKWAQ